MRVLFEPIDSCLPHLLNRPHPPQTHPSIIIEGPEAWAEDGWRRVAIGGLDLRVVKPCSRCKMPNIDQATSEVDMVVTAALKTFRCVSA